MAINNPNITESDPMDDEILWQLSKPFPTTEEELMKTFLTYHTSEDEDVLFSQCQL